jgi:hypothetical protein
MMQTTLGSEHLPMALAETELRRRIDLALGRALVDPGFAKTLLADPLVALSGAGCSPQLQIELRGISATSLGEFANKAQEIFWPSRPAHVGVRTLALVAG